MAKSEGRYQTRCCVYCGSSVKSWNGLADVCKATPCRDKRSAEYISNQIKSSRQYRTKDSVDMSERDFLPLTDYQLCICYFEGWTTKLFAEVFGRSTKSVVSRLEFLMGNGMYLRHLQIFREYAPWLYDRAAKRQKLGGN